jgi:thiol-disulfide isomerase/thioredoxin
MKQFFLALLCLFSCKVYAQDTIQKRIVIGPPNRVKLDTNRLVYDEQGKALHYYQYEKLINTGDYTITYNGSPADPATKSTLKKITDQERNSRYETVKKFMAVKSPLLQENMQLNITPLTSAIKPAELENKVIVLIFWSAECPPCTESFAGLNEFLKQIHNPEDLVLIAITPDDEKVADAKLKEKPLLYAQLLSNGQSIMNAYQLNNYPTFVVADKSRTIRYAITGSGPLTLPMLKSTIKAVLFQ